MRSTDKLLFEKTRVESERELSQMTREDPLKVTFGCDNFSLIFCAPVGEELLDVSVPNTADDCPFAGPTAVTLGVLEERTEDFVSLSQHAAQTPQLQVFIVSQPYRISSALNRFFPICSGQSHPQPSSKESSD